MFSASLAAPLSITSFSVTCSYLIDVSYHYVIRGPKDAPDKIISSLKIAPPSSETIRKMGGKVYACTKNQTGRLSNAQFVHWHNESYTSAKMEPMGKHLYRQSTRMVNGKCFDVYGEDVSKSLKVAAGLLDYPATQGIPIELINTHSLE